MKAKAADHRAQVIDPSSWLGNRVDEMIETRRIDEAIEYLHRLLPKLWDEQRRKHYTTWLGFLYLIQGDESRAQRWLGRVRQNSPADPHVDYALGHLAVRRGACSSATLHFLEAFASATTAHDEAEFLRSAALAWMDVVGPTREAARMLLGALDRDLGNPWILDALARLYEAEQRWMDSLETLNNLSEVVRDAAESLVLHRAPAPRQLLRNQLMGEPARPDELRQRAEAINMAVRDRFEVVLDERRRRGPTAITPLRVPIALGRLIRILDWRERGLELIETAQKLWAQSQAEELDQALGAARLAAAIQVLVERLHWRVPTPYSEIARFHGASQGAIPPAARLVAGRLELGLVDRPTLRAGLNLDERQRLRDLNRALMYGVRLEDVRVGEIRLGC